MLKNRFIEFIRERKLFMPADQILLAVSGGMDSVVMTELFSTAGVNFGIAHCNFLLRGEESDKDEFFVRKLAEQYQVDFFVKRFDTTGYAEDNKLSIQQSARELRYEWFSELLKNEGFDFVATAHHLDDSIETFLINALRGSGLAGLSGIPVKNKTIIRPLLFATRLEIQEYVNDHKLTFRHDTSNDSDHYLRNRIRHQLLPAFAVADPSYRDRLAETVRQIQSARHLIQDFTEEWFQKNVTFDDGKIIIPINLINAVEHPSELLAQLLYQIRITDLPAEKILLSSTGSVFHSGDYRLLKDRQQLIIESAVPEADHPEILIENVPASLQVENKKITLELKEGNLIDDWQELDFNSLQLPLKIRHWKPGDFFVPLGMKGKKKLSDYFTDRKINRFDKDRALVILSGNDIVCILGQQIDERFKINSHTTKKLTIRVTDL